MVTFPAYGRIDQPGSFGTMSIVGPDLVSVRAAAAEFPGTWADRSSATLIRVTAPRIDPALAGHRQALLRWLNAWGCRLRYPVAGEPDLFDTGVAAWWSRWHNGLPAAQIQLGELDDNAILQAAQAYAELAATPAVPGRRPRSLGPTAAAKMLHALRPDALMPWDRAIAQRLHGSRDAAAYAAHQRLGRRWARQLMAEAGVPLAELPAVLGRPGRHVAKLLDDYCYLVCTRESTGDRAARG